MDLHELTLFFEAEPAIHSSDAPWEYGGVSFQFEATEDVVSCRLAPGEGELALVWRQRGVKRAELSLRGYFDMKLEIQAGRERLVAIPDEVRDSTVCIAGEASCLDRTWRSLGPTMR